MQKAWRAKWQAYTNMKVKKWCQIWTSKICPIYGLKIGSSNKKIAHGFHIDPNFPS